MKRKFTVEVHPPTDWNAFNERMAKAMMTVWKDMCPKELQSAALDKCIQELKA